MPELMKWTLSLLVVVFLSGCMNDPSKRTPGVFIDDAVLEPMVRSEIRKSDKGFKGSFEKYLDRYMQTPGRFSQTVEDSSYDAWISLYRGDEESPRIIDDGCHAGRRQSTG